MNTQLSKSVRRPSPTYSKAVLISLFRKSNKATDLHAIGDVTWFWNGIFCITCIPDDGDTERRGS